MEEAGVAVDCCYNLISAQLNVLTNSKEVRISSDCDIDSLFVSINQILSDGTTTNVPSWAYLHRCICHNER